MNITLKKKSKKKKLIIGISFALVLALVIALFLRSCNSAAKADTGSQMKEYDVTRGDISVVVTGTGSIEPIEQYELQSLVMGDILTDNVTLGAIVNKGDLLYTIDSTSATNNIERSKKSLAQQKISYEEQLSDWNKAKKNRTIYAPITGTVTKLYVKNGDTVNNGTKLADIVNYNELVLTIPFLANNAKNIYPNQAATIFLEDRNESVTGYVARVSSGTYATAGGAVVSDVEIRFKNPGAVLSGEQATATIGGYACNESAAISSLTTETVTAKTSGDVTGLTLSEGDVVKGGAVLFTLKDDKSDSSLRSSKLSLENAELALNDLIDKLEDYSIMAPISGTVIEKTLKAGDTLDGNKSSLAIIADMSKLTFEMSIDELDIKDISVGQSVRVTADALPGETFDGVIDTISILGTTTNGVTVYPVTVVISEYKGLLPGMNVNAEIVTSEAKNVLRVPVDAVSRGNLVLVTNEYAQSIGAPVQSKPEKSDDGKPADGKPADGSTDVKSSRMPEAPEGYTWIAVKVGVSDNDFIEVISGLTEGAKVYVTKEQSAAATAKGAFSGMGSGSRSGPPNMSGGSGMGGSGMSSGGMSGGSGRIQHPGAIG